MKEEEAEELTIELLEMYRALGYTPISKVCSFKLMNDKNQELYLDGPMIFIDESFEDE
jgi:hypothetical protein